MLIDIHAPGHERVPGGPRPAPPLLDGAVHTFNPLASLSDFTMLE
jgi:hypothetical protein